MGGRVKNYSVRLIPEVYLDIDELLSWWLDVAGQSAAESLRNSIYEAEERLKTFPEAHKIFDDDFDDIRRYDIPDKNVALLYRVDCDYFEVVAIFAYHTLADPISTKAKLQARLKLDNIRNKK